MARIATRLQETSFDPAEEHQRFCAQAENNEGAIVVFTGLVRAGEGYPKKMVLHLTIEHYPTMAEKLLGRTAEFLAEKYNLTRMTVIHRIDRVMAGEPIVIVLASATHRLDAFNAVQEMMDRLKSDIPLWKKETTTQDSAWIKPPSVG
jgi:molybdopterin synthase catalytic subunit